jgi:two-component system alkaline phosphatase synthesis response regulator PhoP
VEAGEKKPLVLVADDDVDVASLVAVSLRRAGFDVVTAGNGSDALEIALEREPDACVLDIMMPNLNGYEVVRRLKEEPATSDAPIVLLSARAGALDRDYGLRVGADAYIRKPFPPRQLSETLQALLDSAAERRI